jgi:SAM-dependent methyltransferase
MADLPSAQPVPEQKEERLTSRDYWDSIYRGALETPPDEATAVSSSLGRRSALRQMAARCVAHLRGPEWFWDELLPRFIKRAPGATVLELGVAPGDEVLMFRQCFGHEPFGLEYSPAGAAVTCRNFARHDVNPHNVILGDLFDEALMERCEARFDVVFSRGLIEHFTDPSDAIARHVRLAKEAGLVVITIPTLTGLHYAVTRIMMPHQIAIHNLDIMHRQAFERLFEGKGLDPLYCGYGGGLNLLISYNPQPVGFRRLVQALALKMQLLAHLARQAGLCRGRYMNANLVFIGRKRPS